MNRGNMSMLLVTTVVAVIFGVVGLQMWNGMITPMTTQYAVVNESLGTVTTNVPVNLAHNNLQSFDAARSYNATSGALIATLTSSDYTIDLANGVWTLTNDSYNQTVVKVDYHWAESQYITSAVERVILNNLPILLGVGLLILGVGYIGFFK